MASDATERRAFLYHAAGEALHLAKTLELQLVILISVIDRELELDLSVDGLVVPDYRRTLGQLIHHLREHVTLDANGERILAEALEARNDIAYHFFNRHVHAFAADEVFQRTKTVLQARAKTIGIGVAVASGWSLALCDALNVDSKKVLVPQDWADDGTIA